MNKSQSNQCIICQYFQIAKLLKRVIELTYTEAGEIKAIKNPPAEREPSLLSLIENYVATRLDQHRTYMVGANTLYEDFRNYVESKHPPKKAPTKTTFGRALRHLGKIGALSFGKGKIGGVIVYRGLRIKEKN